MGFKVEFEGLPGGARGTLPLWDYSVEEAATPLAAGDSSGSVGTFTLTVPVPDPYVPSAPEGTAFHTLLSLGESIFLGTVVTITDSRKGFTIGTVDSVGRSKDGSSVTLQGRSRMGNLNVYGVQAQPFSGTLGDAFAYYLGLGGETTQLLVDPSIADRPVNFPGWYGELWFYLKQMAAAMDCDVSLVSGVILLRPIRMRIAVQNRDTARATSTGGGTLAQSVEVYQYNNRAISNELVYPPGGWTPEVEVLNVNAGETSEYMLELSASVSHIQPPTMLTFVSQDEATNSVYTVVGDDGLPIDPALWTDHGGSLTISIAQDTSHLEVKITGPTNVPNKSGEASQSFSIALGSDLTGNRYSTLRIVGSGVAFNKVLKRVRTGVPASRTATEVGLTIDNPFISTTDELYTAGTRAAKDFAGVSLSLTGNVVSLNRRGDTGQASYPTYDYVQESLQGDLGPGFTYDDVQTIYGSQTYQIVQDQWNESVRDDDSDQVFGNAQGARVFDRDSRRWYRIRQASLTPGGIGISGADDDLTFADMQGLYGGLTYADVEGFNLGFTYQQSQVLGMWKGEDG